MQKDEVVLSAVPLIITSGTLCLNNEVLSITGIFDYNRIMKPSIKLFILFTFWTQTCYKFAIWGINLYHMNQEILLTSMRKINLVHVSPVKCESD